MTPMEYYDAVGKHVCHRNARFVAFVRAELFSDKSAEEITRAVRLKAEGLK